MNTLTVSEIAKICGATLQGDGARPICGPASLVEATPDEISFLVAERFRSDFDATQAGAVIVPEDFESDPDDQTTLLRSKNPNQAFSEVVRAFTSPETAPPPGVHPTAVIGEGVELADGVSVGPFAVVGAGSTVGPRAVIHPHVVVGRGCSIGEGCVLHPGVVLYARVTIGDGSIVHAGVVLGTDGFGYEPGPAGIEKVPQCGTVEVGKNVEIGALTAVDRARFGSTKIGDGAKLDNLVQIGHNVAVGPHTIICAQAGISGSTQVGSGSVLGGQVGINGHVRVGDGVKIAGGSQVFKGIPDGDVVWGSPARPRGEAMRAVVEAQRLPSKVRELEERLARLEGKGT